MAFGPIPLDPPPEQPPVKGSGPGQSWALVPAGRELGVEIAETGS